MHVDDISQGIVAEQARNLSHATSMSEKEYDNVHGPGSVTADDSKFDRHM